MLCPHDNKPQLFLQFVLLFPQLRPLYGCGNDLATLGAEPNGFEKYILRIGASELGKEQVCFFEWMVALVKGGVGEGTESPV